MSDYLGNLITRTLSEATAVRPQLPSLFEPSVASGQLRSELEFEQETFSESPPITRRSETAPPNPPSILTLQDPVSNKLEARPIAYTVKAPTPFLTQPQSALGEPEPTPIVHGAKTSAPISASMLPSGESALHEPEQIIPQSSRTNGILSAAKNSEPPLEDVVPRPASKRRESKSVPVRAESNVEPVAPESLKNDSRAGQRETGSPRARASEAPTLISQLSTSDSHPRSPSLVRPASPVRRIRAVEAVVPAIRTVPQFLPISARASAPTINVTIGRVEIRATSPAPATQRARPKSLNVLSLEEYLRRRASGGSR